jgi:hypothetical protein
MNTQNLKHRGSNILYDENPFVPSVAVKRKRITNKRGDMTLINNDNGVITSSIAGFWEVQEVDSSQFLKLFINGVKALKELSSAGTKVFEILYIEMQNNIGKDRVYLSIANVNQEITPISKTIYTRGMRELIDKGFLAASSSMNLYWINPDFLWNGDRLAFVKEYYKVDNTPSTSNNRKSINQELPDDEVATQKHQADS